MKTFQDRIDLVEFLLHDPIVDAKLLERFRLLYKWSRYERALRKAKKSRLLATKLEKTLADEVEVLLFRRLLNDVEE